MIMTYEIKDCVLTEAYTAVVRGEMPVAELPAWMMGAFGAVHDYLRRSGVAPTGAPFARIAMLDGTVAAEAGFPVGREIAGDDLVEPSMLPEGHAVTLTHMGPYEEVERAYEAAHRWLDSHGYEPAGPHWEVYYTDPTAEPDPTRWRTDVVVPYRVGQGGVSRSA
ncbi:MAG TPA: GyrI-like domain-containing protein [Pilimelia sp.]|nr:GyrI-like domain-containing protein [Pilimelia sp.]